ncbi:MAG TPA: NAD(P)/FAD-dependent oxidoreductase [Acidimicrobiales bacterium]|nr:NAD(P)/FAD-dependent oxidoreductase [Acidimicrobiales bacterium]
MSASRVAIIGAGFGGIGASVKLTEAGEADHVIFEKQHDVGGTWLANRYPGCRCDVDSNLYSFSFALNPDWSNTFSYQEEIQAYLRGVAERHGVIGHCRFGTEVTAARWDDDAGHWALDLRAADGTTSRHTAEVLISANGFLSEPAIPDFPGLADFGGEVLHSAQWDPSVDLTGKRVAVIGTGASAVQIVPRVQPQAASLHVFQRTPAWILPHPGHDVKERTKRLYRRVPALQRGMRALSYYQREVVVLPALLRSRRLGAIRKLAQRHLEAQVPDPELRAKLTPTFAPGCKRLTPTNEYLPAIAAANCELVTEGIDRFSAAGIVTRDGTERPFDVVILATGFRVTNGTFPHLVTGREGLTMREVWDGASMGAYNGTAMARFPNFFMLAGPNTGIGHTSLVYMIEAQITYVVDAVRYMRANDVAAVEVRPDVVLAFNEELQRKFAQSVWTTGGCASWYLDERGNNPTLWPDYTFRFKRRLERFDAESYYQTQRARPAAVALVAAGTGGGA